MHETPQVLGIVSDSSLQEHHTGGERWARYHITFYACSMQALGNGEVLRESEGANRKTTGVQGHLYHRMTLINDLD